MKPTEQQVWAILEQMGESESMIRRRRRAILGVVAFGRKNGLRLRFDDVLALRWSSLAGLMLPVKVWDYMLDYYIARRRKKRLAKRSQVPFFSKWNRHRPRCDYTECGISLASLNTMVACVERVSCWYVASPWIHQDKLGRRKLYWAELLQRIATASGIEKIPRAPEVVKFRRPYAVIDRSNPKLQPEDLASQPEAAPYCHRA